MTITQLPDEEGPPLPAGPRVAHYSFITRPRQRADPSRPAHLRSETWIRPWPFRSRLQPILRRWTRPVSRYRLRAPAIRPYRSASLPALSPSRPSFHSFETH